jgi:hypothetical protein
LKRERGRERLFSNEETPEFMPACGAGNLSAATGYALERLPLHPAVIALEQITQSWRTKRRRIFVSGKERERRRSSATTSEQRHSQRQKDKSATAI